MIASDPIARLPPLDEPWRRLPWLTPSALLLWMLLLLGFAALLESARRPPETVERLDARLLEIPAPAEPAGLQGEVSAEPPAPAAAPPAPVPPHVEPKRERPAPRPIVEKPKAPTIYDSRGVHTAEAAPVDAAATEQAPAEGAAAATSGGAGGRAGGGSGLGSDSTGARALYAPVPKIPDDLREEVFETVAVAHFQVTFNGDASVSLVKATTNPRLNSLLLDTLRQWRFAPAVRGGVAIDSAFDVRIPIAVE